MPHAPVSCSMTPNTLCMLDDWKYEKVLLSSKSAAGCGRLAGVQLTMVGGDSVSAKNTTLAVSSRTLRAMDPHGHLTLTGQVDRAAVLAHVSAGGGAHPSLWDVSQYVHGGVGLGQVIARASRWRTSRDDRN